MDKLDSELLYKISDLHGIPEGSYNIRKDGKSIGRASDPDIEILSRKDGKEGIDIFVRPGVKNKSAHIPVILTQGGLLDVVYNDFYIGKGADVTIIAGCGIHNDTCGEARHDACTPSTSKRGAPCAISSGTTAKAIRTEKRSSLR